MAKTRLLAFALALGVTVTLSACVPDFGFVSGGGGGGGGGGSSTTSPAPSTDDEDNDAVDNAVTDPASCLVGTWNADNAFFLALLKQFGDQVQNVGGQVTVSYADDGTFTTTYADWNITAVEEGIEVVVRRNGTDSGVYTADETAMNFSDTQIGSAITMTGPGFEMAVEPIAAAYTNAPYTCDATTATITTQDGTLNLARA